MLAQRFVYLTFGGLVLMQLGSALTSPSTWRVIFLVAAILGSAACAVLVERDIRRARHFLRTHPQPA